MTQPHVFCTYFDRNYLARALVLHQSLQRHCPAFRLWALCLDDAAYDLLEHLALENVRPVRLCEFEAGDEELLAAKPTRSRVEYYFTLTPSLPLHVFRADPDAVQVSYVDADIRFFAGPEPVFDEIGGASAAIIPHRFPPRLGRLERFGRFNVGFLSFRRDAAGLACLDWWRRRCIEWCYDRLSAGRYADQKYLDQWPDRFEGVHVIRHKGANLAPWNLETWPLRREGPALLVGDEPLLFYHYQGLKALTPWFYDAGLEVYGAPMSNTVLRGIYAPYVLELLAAERRIRNVGGSAGAAASLRHVRRGSSPAAAVRRWTSIVRRMLTLLPTRRYLLIWRGQVH